MKDNQQKNQVNDKDLLKDINSVPKAVTGQPNENVDDPKKPAKGGRFDANSTQNGGQDAGSSAGSH